MGQLLTWQRQDDARRSNGATAPVAKLSKPYGINEKTVIKCRGRQSVEGMPMRPKEQGSTVLSPMEEAAIVALRVQARLPLDDVFIARQDVIPHLTRSPRPRELRRGAGTWSPDSLTGWHQAGEGEWDRYALKRSEEVAYPVRGGKAMLSVEGRLDGQACTAMTVRPIVMTMAAMYKMQSSDCP